MINNPILLTEVRAQLRAMVQSTPQEVKRFFKTAPGSYGEHDEFLGVKVPDVRRIAKQFNYADITVIQELLHSPFNEERLLALFMLVNQYQTGDAATKEALYHFYIKNTQYVNNWNLVDSSAHLIVGHYLADKNHGALLELAQSPIIWERRIAIVATLHDIRRGNVSTTFTIAQLLLNDPQDLIHKAVGWMLREAGKQNQDLLLAFLLQHYKKIPRTMVRYAIEKLEPAQKLLFKST